MRVGLIICPHYSGGTAVPLGLAYINAVLSKLKIQTIPLDVEFILSQKDPIINEIINGIFGLPAHNSRQVLFMIQPELMLYALYPEAFKNANITINNKWPYIDKIREVLVGFVEEFIINKIDIAMFSVYTTNLATSLIVAQNIRKKLPIPIIMGGPGVSIPEVYAFILKAGLANGIIIGEGEGTIKEVLERNAIENSECNIPGYVSADSISSVCNRQLLDNLNILPFPAFDHFPAPGYNPRAYILSGQNTYLPIAASRGCLSKCSFCSETQYWKKLRYRTVESVIDEIEYQVKKYNIHNIRFNDSMINFDNEWLELLCRNIIEKNICINWVFAYFRPAGITKTIAKLLKSAGCRRVDLGVESGSIRIREAMRKRTSNSDILSALRLFEDEGINTIVNIISGFPNEQLNDTFDNIRLFNEWNKSLLAEGSYVNWASFGLLRIEPQSQIFLHPERYGISLRPYQMRLPRELDFIKKEISRNLIIWEDSTNIEEKYLRENVLKGYFISRQGKNRNQIMGILNFDSSSITESTIVKYDPTYHMTKINDNKYLIEKENVVQLHIDRLLHEVLLYISDQPHTFGEIYCRFKRKPNDNEIAERLKEFIALLLNTGAIPVIKILENEDMKEDISVAEIY